MLKEGRTKKYLLFSHVKPTRIYEKQGEKHISFRRIKPTYIYE